MTPHAQPLAWVRASASAKKAAASKSKPATPAAGDGADILLESPVATGRETAPTQWKLAPPTFSQPRAEKRLPEEESENDPLLSDLVRLRSGGSGLAAALRRQRSISGK